jgi:hypothetical protein
MVNLQLDGFQGGTETLLFKASHIGLCFGVTFWNKDALQEEEEQEEESKKGTLLFLCDVNIFIFEYMITLQSLQGSKTVPTGLLCSLVIFKCFGGQDG